MLALQASEFDTDWDLENLTNSEEGDPLFVEWSQIADEEAPQLLNRDGLRIAQDGGMSGITELMYPMQYCYAGLLLMSAAANVFIICRQANLALQGTENSELDKAESMFLLSKSLVGGFSRVVLGLTLGPEQAAHVHLLVPLLELTVMLCLAIRIVYSAVMAVLAPWLPRIYGQAGELYRWRYVSDLFWNYFEHLSTFSAMRLLYFVTPSVVFTEGYVVAWLVKDQVAAAETRAELLRALRPVLKYLGGCLIYMVIGLDAFLVKYRLASKFIMSEELSIWNLMCTLIFLVQVLGIVNLNRFCKQRLFILIFGGEDGNVEPEEKLRWEVWKCFLTKNIYKTFGFFHGTVIMMGFDDYDIQSLVLDDDKKASSPAARANARRRPSRRSQRQEECRRDARASTAPFPSQRLLQRAPSELPTAYKKAGSYAPTLLTGVPPSPGEDECGV
jgi:hypothetical protein